MSSIVKVDTIQENTSANGITVDGLNIKDSKLVTANSVVNSNITNDAVTVDKLNLISTSSVPSLEAKGDGSSQDGYIQLNCSQNSHGIKLKSPAHSAGASYTLTFPPNDGDADQFLKTDGSGGLSFAAAGGANTPLFRAHQSAGLNIDHNTATKISFNAETFDPQSTFNDGKFTPAVSGKYFLSASVRMAVATYNQLGLMIYKNGSGIAYQWHNTDSGSGNPSATVSTVGDSDTNDYFEIYFYHYKGSTAGVSTGSENTWFNGFKLIT